MALTITPRPAPAEVLSFGPLRFIPGRKGGRYPYCHSLVLTGPETWVVDPAADQDYFRDLAGSRRVTRVFLSHFHEDHQKYHYLFPEAHFLVPAPEEGPSPPWPASSASWALKTGVTRNTGGKP